MKTKIISISISISILIFALTACTTPPTDTQPAADTSILEIDIPADVGIIDATVEEEGGVLRIASLYYDPEDTWSHGMLTDAKTLFEEKFPNWKVAIEPEGEMDITVEHFDDGSSTMVSRSDFDAEERFFGELPHRLVRENGPDVIVLSGADTERLIKEGLLMDMFSLFESDDALSLDRLLPGVVSTISTERALYTLPMTFSTRMLNVYDWKIETSVTLDTRPSPWEWDDLPRVFETDLEKADYLFAMPPRVLTQTLVNNYFSYLYDFDTDAFNFDSPVFKEILRTVKYFYDRGLLWDIDHTEEFMRGLEGGLFLDVFLWVNVRDYSSFELKYVEPWGTRIYYPLPSIRGAEGMAITPLDVYAINENAANKTAAWEFIKILLSDEIQNGEGMTYQPVISDLNEDAIKRAMGVLEITEEQVFKYNQERYAFFSDINRIAGRGNAPDVSFIIVDQADRFYKDEIDMEQMIAELKILVEQELAG